MSWCRLSDSVRECERLKVQMEERDHEVAKLMRRLEVSRSISSVLLVETFSSRSQLTPANIIFSHFFSFFNQISVFFYINSGSLWVILFPFRSSMATMALTCS